MAAIPTATTTAFGQLCGFEPPTTYTIGEHLNAMSAAVVSRLDKIQTSIDTVLAQLLPDEPTPPTTTSDAFPRPRFAADVRNSRPTNPLVAPSPLHVWIGGFHANSLDTASITAWIFPVIEVRRISPGAVIATCPDLQLMEAILQRNGTDELHFPAGVKSALPNGSRKPDARCNQFRANPGPSTANAVWTLVPPRGRPNAAATARQVEAAAAAADPAPIPPPRASRNGAVAVAGHTAPGPARPAVPGSATSRGATAPGSRKASKGGRQPPQRVSGEGNRHPPPQASDRGRGAAAP